MAYIPTNKLTGRRIILTQDGVKEVTEVPVTSITTTKSPIAVQGIIDVSKNPYYPIASRGNAFLMMGDGRIGGESGVDLKSGDLIICIAESTKEGIHPDVGKNWLIVPKTDDRITGDVMGPDKSLNNSIPLFDGTTGKLLKDSKKTFTNYVDLSGEASTNRVPTEFAVAEAILQAIGSSGIITNPTAPINTFTLNYNGGNAVTSEIELPESAVIYGIVLKITKNSGTPHIPTVKIGDGGIEPFANQLNGLTTGELGTYQFEYYDAIATSGYITFGANDTDTSKMELTIIFSVSDKAEALSSIYAAKSIAVHMNKTPNASSTINIPEKSILYDLFVQVISPSSTMLACRMMIGDDTTQLQSYASDIDFQRQGIYHYSLFEMVASGGKLRIDFGAECDAEVVICLSFATSDISEIPRSYLMKSTKMRLSGRDYGIGDIRVSDGSVLLGLYINVIKPAAKQRDLSMTLNNESVFTEYLSQIDLTKIGLYHFEVMKDIYIGGDLEMYIRENTDAEVLVAATFSSKTTV